jgi:hypothetical protein
MHSDKYENINTENTYVGIADCKITDIHIYKCGILFSRSLLPIIRHSMQISY